MFCKLGFSTQRFSKHPGSGSFNIDFVARQVFSGTKIFTRASEKN